MRTTSIARSTSRVSAGAMAMHRPAVSISRSASKSPSISNRSASEGLVRDLCALADTVLFAAAIPFQGGAGHINERWQSWWAQKFSENGYDPFDVLRRDIWGRRDIAWWYKQNTILYVKRNSPAHARFSARFAQPAAAMFDLGPSGAVPRQGCAAEAWQHHTEGAEPLSSVR